MNTSKPTVHVSNPEKIIEIEGESFANLILHQCMHIENLLRAVQAINAINLNDQDERLTELQISLQAMANSTSGVLVEQVRMAKAQGLVLDIGTGPTNVIH